jgi:DNA-binding beta-propeller fold protein YncE
VAAARSGPVKVNYTSCSTPVKPNDLRRSAGGRRGPSSYRDGLHRRRDTKLPFNFIDWGLGLRYAFGYNPDDDRVFCTLGGAGDVIAIDGARDSIIKSIFVGTAPGNIVRDPVHDRMYVANVWSHDIAVIRDSTLGIEERPPQAARSGRLAVYPNPFRSRAVITFSAGRTGAAVLHIHDVAGRVVRTLPLARSAAPVSGSVTWDGADDSGRNLPAGVYFVRLSAGGWSVDREVLLLR